MAPAILKAVKLASTPPRRHTTTPPQLAWIIYGHRGTRRNHLGDAAVAKCRLSELGHPGCSEIERESLGGIRRARGGGRGRVCRSPLLGDLSDDAPF